MPVDSYAVTAEVSDSERLISQETIHVNVIAISTVTSVSIADTDGGALSVGNGDKWRAEAAVKVRDNENSLVQGAIVAGVWSGGGSANVASTTGADGRCTVSLGGLKRNDSSAVLAVTGITDELVYEPTGNYDLDGDSDGSTITILRP